MPIKFENNTISKMFIDNKEVKKVYLGDQLLYTKQVPRSVWESITGYTFEDIDYRPFRVFGTNALHGSAIRVNMSTWSIEYTASANEDIEYFRETQTAYLLCAQNIDNEYIEDMIRHQDYPPYDPAIYTLYMLFVYDDKDGPFDLYYQLIPFNYGEGK